MPRSHSPRPARAKSSASPASQSGFLHDIHDVGRLHPECLLERLVTASLLPAVERAGLRVAEVLGENRRLSGIWMVRKAHYVNRARSSGTLSGVTDSMNS